MDELDRLYRLLVDSIKAQQPELLTRPFEVADVYQSILPYRLHRRALGMETNSDYEMTLLRLLSGERGYIIGDDEMQDAFRRELATPNPDPGAFRPYAQSHVALAADALRRLEQGGAAAPSGTGRGMPTPAATPTVAPRASAGQPFAPAAAPRARTAADASGNSATSARGAGAHAVTGHESQPATDDERPSSLDDRRSARWAVPLLQRRAPRRAAADLLPALRTEPDGAALPRLQHGARGRLEVLHDLRPRRLGRLMRVPLGRTMRRRARATLAVASGARVLAAAVVLAIAISVATLLSACAGGDRADRTADTAFAPIADSTARPADSAAAAARDTTKSDSVAQAPRDTTPLSSSRSTARSADSAVPEVARTLLSCHGPRGTATEASGRRFADSVRIDSEPRSPGSSPSSATASPSRRSAPRACRRSAASSIRWPFTGLRCIVCSLSARLDARDSAAAGAALPPPPADSSSTH